MIPLVVALVALGGPRAVLSGPEQTAVTADGRFVIHYTTEGVDAVDPAWVEWAEEGLARVWAAYVDDAGWPAPAPDQGIGGDDRLDLYLRVLDSNGYAHVETATGSCWMEADPGIASGLGRTTFASVVGHELHHCLQFAIGTGLEGWIYEATSTYAQYLLFSDDQAIELARDALWGLRLTGSEKRLDDEGGTFEYAGMVWVKYVVDAGGDLLALWEAMAASGGWVAGHEALLGPVADAAADFAEWNAFACHKDDGRHYVADNAQCGSELDVGGMDVTALPASGDGGPLGLYGSDYVELIPDQATRDLHVTVTATGRVHARLLTDAGYDGVSFMDSTERLEWPDWNERSRAVLVVTALTDGATFTWSAEGSGIYVPPEPEPEPEDTGCCSGAPASGGPIVLALIAITASRRRGRRAARRR